MLPVLLASSKGEVRIGEIVNQLADQLDLTPEERTELLTSGKQTIFSNRVHWAKTYLNKAHLVEITRRGYFKSLHVGKKSLNLTHFALITAFSRGLRSSANQGKIE